MIAAKFLTTKTREHWVETVHPSRQAMIPADASPSTSINCSECGRYLGTWDELQTDFEKQGGGHGMFRLDQGRIQRLDD